VGEGRIEASMSPSSRRFSVLASMPYAVKAGQQLLHVLGDPVPLSGPVRVMFGSAATARLIDAIAQGFLDGAVPRFLMGDEGTPRALNRRLNLLDDGGAIGGLRSRSFDDRGVVPKPVMLIRDGKVAGRLVSLGDARRQEIEATGHEVKGRLRPSNLTLMSGTRSLNAIAIARGGPSLWIEDLPALTPGALDLTSGRLSCRVNGRVLEGNVVKGVVRGVQLTGDFGVALEQVVEIASDTDRKGHIDAPGLVVDGLSVGADASS
jgi:predicted Zn-dependent protease